MLIQAFDNQEDSPTTKLHQKQDFYGFLSKNL